MRHEPTALPHAQCSRPATRGGALNQGRSRASGAGNIGPGHRSARRPPAIAAFHRQGLSASDAAAILKTVGPNRIDSAAPKRLLADFIGRFSNPLVLVLLFAAAVSAFTGDVPSFVIITVIVLMSVILDVVQEHQAENAAERLREQVSLSAKGFAMDSQSTSLRQRSCLAISFFSQPAISCPPIPG
jgi:Cation transporter/ATPase, N-terminus